MTKKSILVVDNSPVVLRLMENFLLKEGHQVICSVDGLEALTVLKDFRPDIIFIDLVMPKIPGEKLCRIIRTQPELDAAYIIILSGVAMEQELDFLAIGAQACIAKGPFCEIKKHILSIFTAIDSGDVDKISKEVIGIENIYKRVTTEELLAVKKHFDLLLDHMREGFIEMTQAGQIVNINRFATVLLGQTEEKIISSYLFDFFDEIHATQLKEVFIQLETTPAALGKAQTFLLKDRHITITLFSVAEHGQKSVVAIFHDITERKQAEVEKAELQAQLNQAQKMETIGILAGGIAHDYNNLLTAVLGNIELARDMANDSLQDKTLIRAEEATLMAAALTKKFITFSSGGSPTKKAINPQKFLKDTANIALSGSNIHCDFSIDQDLGMVEIDQGLMSQAIGNIVTNAKEAMPQGGAIHLTAHNMSGEQITHDPGLDLQGDFFVKITVEDLGEGISKKNLGKIFDPYFSSKERGTQKGMGLGLTIANSIIKKHAGHLQVESEKGKGTTVSIYLPALPQNEAIVCQTTDKIVDFPAKTPEKKTTRILVMDDEEMLRDMTKVMLKHLGYKQVEVASNGEDALNMYTQSQDRGKPFDLLLLDLTIKGGMGGQETIKRLHEINPEVRAIVCSGYSQNPVLANYAVYGFNGVLAKPFSREELGNAITQALYKK